VIWDVVIAGAGPAGAVAAHVLAQAGKRVLMADIPFAGTHKIGEALPAAAGRLLRDLDLPLPSAPHTPIGGNLSSWGSPDLQASDAMRDPDGPGWRLDRLRFDADLLSAARSSGAAHHAAHITTATRHDALWKIELDNSTQIEACWLIDATGRRAAIVRRHGAKRSRDARLVAIYALGQPSEGLELNRTLVETVPNGWWYAARLPSGAAIVGFHLHPRDAVKLLAQPNGWRDALARTRHLSRLLDGVAFDTPLRPVEACGARLDRFSGDGWIACGDAALSFDPVSSQGIFSALHGGMRAARALLEDDTAAYTESLEAIRQTYLSRWRSLCRSERQWPDSPFWASYGWD
jgi:flavin-dependent dehydrogenase